MLGRNLYLKINNMTKISEIRDMNNEQLKNHRQYRTIKKDISKILTILKEKSE